MKRYLLIVIGLALARNAGAVEPLAIGECVGGMAISLAIHKTSHYGAGKLLTHDLERWNGWTWKTTESHATTQVAGIFMQGVASEAVLDLTDKETRRPVWNGMLWMGAACEILYPTIMDKYFRKSMAGGGDFEEDFTHKGLWRAVFVGHAMITGARMLWQKEKSATDNLFFSPVPGGALVGLRWEW